MTPQTGGATQNILRRLKNILKCLLNSKAIKTDSSHTFTKSAKTNCPLSKEKKYTTRNLQNTSYSKKERYTRRKRDLKDKRDGVPWAPLVSANPRICHPFQWTQCPLQVRSFTAPLSTCTSHSHSLSLYSLISWLQSAGPYNYLTNCAGGPDVGVGTDLRQAKPHH